MDREGGLLTAFRAREYHGLDRAALLAEGRPGDDPAAGGTVRIPVAGLRGGDGCGRGDLGDFQLRPQTGEGQIKTFAKSLRVLLEAGQEVDLLPLALDGQRDQALQQLLVFLG